MNILCVCYMSCVTHLFANQMSIIIIQGRQQQSFRPKVIAVALRKHPAARQEIYIYRLLLAIAAEKDEKDFFSFFSFFSAFQLYSVNAY